ncbi:hypothetical protein P153DRAFT_282090 [Dothidotthia symphoricarpi CBS 119687]|uniref:F-box domain-containing protein n=1 Tax=Dothidotthia symphoricarpi CBS 119687 TaxID=1392245 RepID=A0A6A6AP10_9PLEO|nr:uncharacterized protein P153DRAFT_282090 [Dothidotthia symphoricarpi CBS 119687]KAF2133530.1 hypothetical protein P153DRAFT_282090 [Dothidotthia symphoricarpi CBS 119687]
MPARQFPAHTFQNLPREVYDCIIAQLEQIHLGQTQTCRSCYLKDLYGLSLTSRSWSKAATPQLYHKVFVLTNEDHPNLPKLRIRGAGRLKLLRRTLLERNALAQCVRELDMSDFQLLYQNATIDREEIVNLVASLVMACPNLERLLGFHIPYTRSSFDRLSHALSTRSKLKERLWLLAEPDLEFMDEEEFDMSGCYNPAYDPTEQFLELNSNHTVLDTLVLHQDHEHSPSPLNFRAIIGTIRQFPLLQNLSICGLAAASFTNMTLSALPSNLRSLSLENLPGLNEKGLQRLTASPLAASLESLKLISMKITSLVTIANILSSRLANLKYFALVQHRAPGLSSWASLPDFYSPSVQRIHWEIRTQAGPLPALHPPPPRSFSRSESPKTPSFPLKNSEPISCLATSLLATSIQDGAFPSLRSIRIPHDPQGLIQALCKPLATALLPTDASLFTSPPRTSNPAKSSTLLDAHLPLSPKFGNPRADSAMDSPTSSVNFSHPMLTPMRSRLAAQCRILAARNNPSTAVRIYDPKGNLRIDKVVGGYIGCLESKIVYELKPDRGCTIEYEVEDGDVEGSYWITGVEDVTGQRGIAGVRRTTPSACDHSASGRVGINVARVSEMC